MNAPPFIYGSGGPPVSWQDEHGNLYRWVSEQGGWVLATGPALQAQPPTPPATLPGGPNDPPPPPPPCPASSSSAVPVPGSSQARVESLAPPRPKLSSGADIAAARGHSPASRIAGQRRTSKPKSKPSGKDKGKARDIEVGQKRKVRDDDDDHEDEPRKKTRAGSKNFVEAELANLDAVMRDIKPTGQAGWRIVGQRQNAWAAEHGYPQRETSSLENKYKMLARTKKPTGDPNMPVAVRRAKATEQLLRDHVHTVDLDDEDIVDADSGSASSGDDGQSDMSSDAEDDTMDIKPVAQRAFDKNGPVAKAVTRDLAAPPAAPARRGRGAAVGLEAMRKIADNLDPALLERRDSERAATSLQTTQIIALTQQLRDSTATSERLRDQITTLMGTHNTQLADAERRVHAAERRADVAERELRLLHLVGDVRGRSHIDRRGRVDIAFADGGSMTTFDDEENLSGYYERTSPGRRVRWTPRTPQHRPGPHPDRGRDERRVHASLPSGYRHLFTSPGASSSNRRTSPVVRARHLDEGPTIAIQSPTTVTATSSWSADYDMYSPSGARLRDDEEMQDAAGLVRAA